MIYGTSSSQEKAIWIISFIRNKLIRIQSIFNQLLGFILLMLLNEYHCGNSAAFKFLYVLKMRAIWWIDCKHRIRTLHSVIVVISKRHILQIVLQKFLWTRINNFKNKVFSRITFLLCHALNCHLLFIEIWTIKSIWFLLFLCSFSAENVNVNFTAWCFQSIGRKQIAQKIQHHIAYTNEFTGCSWQLLFASACSNDHGLLPWLYTSRDQTHCRWYSRIGFKLQPVGTSAARNDLSI